MHQNITVCNGERSFIVLIQGWSVGVVPAQHHLDHLQPLPQQEPVSSDRGHQEVYANTSAAYPTHG